MMVLDDRSNPHRVSVFAAVFIWGRGSKRYGRLFLRAAWSTREQQIKRLAGAPLMVILGFGPVMAFGPLIGFLSARFPPGHWVFGLSVGAFLVVWASTLLLALARVARMNAPAHISAAKQLGRCPLCDYTIVNLEPERDRCTVCPECGGAWRLPRTPAAGVDASEILPPA